MHFSLGNRLLTFSIAALIIMLVLGPRASFGQSINGVNPTSTTAGQNITMIITGAGTNFTAVTSCQLRHSIQTGTIYQGLNYVASSPTSATVDFSIPPNAPLGNYNLVSAGPVFPGYFNALNVGVGPGSSYGFVSGKFIDDANSNCIEDFGDSPFANTIVTLTPGPVYLTTGPLGDYSGWIPNGNYTASVIGPYSCGTWVCPTNGTHPVNVPTPLSQDINNDFFRHEPPCIDLGTGMASNILRPGFTVNTTVVFSNWGTQVASNVTGTYILDSHLTYLSASVPPTQMSGDTLRWTFPTIGPTVFNHITVTVKVDSATMIGTTIHLNSSVPVQGNDPQLFNNTVHSTFVVQGSYDPNDKLFWDINGNNANGLIDPGTSKLSYMIRFQNTGTDTAFNIVLRDTLDPHLNGGTLRVTGYSHPYQMSLTGSRNVRFTFPHIMLVDSFHNEPASHGFISYEIDLNPNVPSGTTIQNRASIYFDYNAPVLTNTTSSTLCALLNGGFLHLVSGHDCFFFDQSGTSAISWQWDFGDGSTSTSQNPSHYYANGGTYLVCLTATNDCRSETFCDTVTICRNLNEAFSYVMGAGGSMNFTDLSDSSATNWAWDFGDGGTSSLQNPSHTYASSGSYNVCLEVSNGCSTATTCQNVTFVGVIDELGTAISVYPNPSGGTFTLNMDVQDAGEYAVSLFDVRGVCIDQQELSVPTGGFRHTFDLSGHASGVYFLRVMHAGSMQGLILQKQ